MSVNQQQYKALLDELSGKGVTLVAVSKIKPVEDISALYDLGQRDFGENYVQELADKQQRLPSGIRWHYIGHLQSNKVKYIAPFVHLVHGIDSLKLLKEVNRQALKNNRTIRVLLQVHIAKEETKFGFDESEVIEALNSPALRELSHIEVAGFMGMASFSDNLGEVRAEFRKLKALYDRCSQIRHSNLNFSILSMGMSADYRIAIEEGSNMVRIGSLVFGHR